MFKRFIVYIIAAIAFGVFCYWKGCSKGTTSVSPAILKPGESEIILVDPSKHRITLVDKKGLIIRTLPYQPSKIIVGNDGKVTVTSSQFGYQQRPFVGYGFANKWRAIGGCDLFFFKKLDLGVGISFEPYRVFESLRVVGILSYCIWSNTRIGIGFDHTGQLNGFVSIRL